MVAYGQVIADGSRHLGVRREVKRSARTADERGIGALSLAVCAVAGRAGCGVDLGPFGRGSPTRGEASTAGRGVDVRARDFLRRGGRTDAKALWLAISEIVASRVNLAGEKGRAAGRSDDEMHAFHVAASNVTLPSRRTRQARMPLK